MLLYTRNFHGPYQSDPSRLGANTQNDVSESNTQNNDVFFFPILKAVADVFSFTFIKTTAVDAHEPPDPSGSVGAQALFLPIRRRIKNKNKTKKQTQV